MFHCTYFFPKRQHLMQNLKTKQSDTYCKLLELVLYCNDTLECIKIL